MVRSTIDDFSHRTHLFQLGTQETNTTPKDILGPNGTYTMPILKAMVYRSTANSIQLAGFPCLPLGFG